MISFREIMMKLYKLTDSNGQTRASIHCSPIQWGEGVVHTAPGTGPIYSDGWIYAYTDPLLATLLNPIHGNLRNPQLWVCVAEGRVLDDRDPRLVATRLKTIYRIPLPQITLIQRQIFGILCAMEVCKDHEYILWAGSWLTSHTAPEDRMIHRLVQIVRGAEEDADAAAAAWWAVQSTIRDVSQVVKATAAAVESAIRVMKIDLIFLAHKAITY